MGSVITFEYLLKLKMMKIKKEKLPNTWQEDVDGYILGKLKVLAMWRKELDSAGYMKTVWQNRYEEVKKTIEEAESIREFLTR